MKTATLCLAMMFAAASSSTPSESSTCAVYREAALTWRAVAQKRTLELTTVTLERDAALLELEEAPPPQSTSPSWIVPAFIAASLGGVVVGLLIPKL